MTNLDKDRLDAAFEAYWAAEGGTFKSIEAAIQAYLVQPQTEASDLQAEVERLRKILIAPGLSPRQRYLDASVTPRQAAEDVRREREWMANRDKPHPQPDGFINDYD